MGESICVRGLIDVQDNMRERAQGEPGKEDFGVSNEWKVVLEGGKGGEQCEVGW